MLEPDAGEPASLAAHLADLAVRAMIYEVCVNPKPGLVDPICQGPHPDMDVFTFIDSAQALRPYFERCAAIGAQANTQADRTIGPDLLSVLRPVGVRAEQTMLAATGGVNTHKGAIFSLGILVAGSACAQARGSRDALAAVRLMTAGLTDRDLELARSKPACRLTAGERQCLLLGSTGVRGEAEAGFPTVYEFGLPALRAARGTRNQRLLDALMAIIAHETDSNLLKRAGDDMSVVFWAQERARSVLAAGGAATAAGMAAAEDMNRAFLERRLSLGGAADMLILTIFLALQEGLLEGP